MTSSIPRSSVVLGLCLFMAGYLFSSISRLFDCSSTLIRPMMMTTTDLGGASHRSVQAKPFIEQEEEAVPTFPTKSVSPFSKVHLQGIAMSKNQLFPDLKDLPRSTKKPVKTAGGFPETALAAHQHLRDLSRSKSVHVLMPDIARDNDLIGKSCRFGSETRDWECRDCGLEHAFQEWQECPTLPRNHMCGELRNNNDWDRPQPRSYTYLETAGMEAYNILTHYENAPVHHAQIPCDDLEQCWNMTRCDSSGGPMTVYVRHAKDQSTRAQKFAKLAAMRYPEQIQVVDHPSEACLLVVAFDAFDSVQDLQADKKLWNEGRNHFIWESNRCFDTRADRPFDYPHYARASLATSSLVNANIRPHYDIPLARTKDFVISEANYSQVLASLGGQDRRWLVAFKGNVYTDWGQVWWQHRWMAAEYWDKSNDPKIAVDVTCDIKPNYTHEYDYLELLMNSTFAFCPGGGATQSFRFTEALALGAIPVVTPELLPPFAYDLDWSGCVVRISAARIVDMPRLLRLIPKEEIRQRQARCQALFETTVGWVPYRQGQWKIDVDRTLFMTSLRIWASRIQQHFQKQQAKVELEQSLFVVSKDVTHDYAL